MDRAFRRAVLERLTVLDEMVEQPGADLTAPLARTELRRIAGGWRDLLRKHQPDPAGRCPVCSGWLRRRKWPCEVWITAHRQLIGDAADVTQQRPALGGAFRRPRDVEVVARSRPPDDADSVADVQIPSARGLLPEGDPVRIHRAAVTARPPTMPLPRLVRRPGR